MKLAQSIANISLENLNKILKLLQHQRFVISEYDAYDVICPRRGHYWAMSGYQNNMHPHRLHLKLSSPTLE